MAATLTGWTLAIDLDGTLVETAPDLSAALNHVLGNEGLAPVPLADIRHMIGHGARAMIREGLTYHGKATDEALIETKLFPRFIEYYLDHICDESRPYEGAIESLESLRRAGARLSVCTNKTQKLAETVLEGLSLAGLFDSVLGADRASAQKPSPAHIREAVSGAGGDPNRAIMIGDSQTDERAARAAGLPFIFVTFGYGDTGDLHEVPAEPVNHWRHMLPAVSRIVGT